MLVQWGFVELEGENQGRETLAEVSAVSQIPSLPWARHSRHVSAAPQRSQECCLLSCPTHLLLFCTGQNWMEAGVQVLFWIVQRLPPVD